MKNFDAFVCSKEAMESNWVWMNINKYEESYDFLGLAISKIITALVEGITDKTKLKEQIKETNKGK